MPMSRSVPYTREAVWTRSRVFWIDAAVVAVTILPLLLTQHLPLADLPNHLARMYILRDWHNSPNLQAFYVPHWALVPNLALELFVLALRPVLSPDGAVRAFCIVTVLMLFLGTRSVNRAVSDGAATAYRVAPLLVYGGPFQYGFLSYCFGVGLALVAFGWYLRLRPLTGWRLPLVMALGFALLLCHLAAFGLFALALGGCELAAAFEASRGHWRRLPAEILRRQIAPVGCLVPVLAVFLLLSPTADPAMAAENVVRFSTLQEKLRSVAAITLFTQPRLETALLALALAGLAVALVLRAVRVHRVLAFVVPLMALLWLVLPNIAAHTSFIDYRLPWAISFFLLGGIVAGPSWHRYRSLLAAGFGTLAFARVTLIAVLWLRWEPTLAAIDHALSDLPPGVAMQVIQGKSPNGGVFRDPDLSNVAAYATARRSAFEPGIFASFAGQVIDFRGEALQLWRQDGRAGERPDHLDDLQPAYRYVLVLLPETARIAPSLPLTCAAAGPHFELLRVVPPEQALSRARC